MAALSLNAVHKTRLIFSNAHFGFYKLWNEAAKKNEKAIINSKLYFLASLGIEKAIEERKKRKREREERGERERERDGEESESK